MRNSLLFVTLTVSVLLSSGCGPGPAPVAPAPAPPPPPPVSVTPTPVEPVAEIPAARPVAELPPELIAKADEFVAVIKKAQADAAKIAANPGDGFDGAVGVLEQQAKISALGGEITALVNALTPEQQAEFGRRYQSQLSGLVPNQLPTTAAPVNNPSAP